RDTAKGVGFWARLTAHHPPPHCDQTQHAGEARKTFGLSTFAGSGLRRTDDLGETTGWWGTRNLGEIPGDISPRERLQRHIRANNRQTPPSGGGTTGVRIMGDTQNRQSTPAFERS